MGASTPPWDTNPVPVGFCHLGSKATRTSGGGRLQVTGRHTGNTWNPGGRGPFRKVPSNQNKRPTILRGSPQPQVGDLARNTRNGTGG